MHACLVSILAAAKFPVFAYSPWCNTNYKRLKPVT